MKLMWCSGVERSMVNLRRGWGQSAMDICAFFYLWNLFGVVVFIDVLSIGGGTSDLGICAFCYIWNLCSVVVLIDLWSIGEGGWGQSAMGICAFCYMWNFCSVVVFQRSMLNWGVCLPLVYVHSSICETYLV